MTPHDHALLEALLVIDGRTVDPDEPIYTVRATSTQPRSCSLCGWQIPPNAPRLVWSWHGDHRADEPADVIHAHAGCDALRREIGLDEWDEGDLACALREHVGTSGAGLAELDAMASALTEEERVEGGAAVLDATRDAIREWLVDEDGGDCAGEVGS